MTHSRLDAHRQRARAARQQLITAANDLLVLLEHEDPASPVTANYDPGGSSGAGSPTEGQAEQLLERHEPRRHLGRIVAVLEEQARVLEGKRRDLRATRTPTSPCWCCHDELATHTRRVHGEPVDVCAACHDFQRNNDGMLCGEETHRLRPKVRWCDCPLECCPSGCPDRAAESRNVSERCRSRMRRRSLGQEPSDD